MSACHYSVFIIFCLLFLHIFPCFFPPFAFYFLSLTCRNAAPPDDGLAEVALLRVASIVFAEL